MGKRDEQRKQVDRDFEEIRQAVAKQSTEWLCDALRDIPHRKWIEIEKDSHFAVGIIAHRAAERMHDLESALRELLQDTQHAKHNCGDGPDLCPVARARELLGD